ncbi:MAG: rhomboid family intramembrane serine protease [Candidatus Binatia bacterium]
MTNGSEIPLRITPDHNLAQDWALVLVTQGLTPSLRVTQEGVILSVPEEEIERALASLSAYEKENPAQAEKLEADSDDAPSLIAGIVVAGLLLVSHFVSVGWNDAMPWFERGSADAGRILSGELWRTVTALTLHADLAHALSNAVAAGIFASALSGMVGAGVAFAFLVLAGAGGNLVNAFFHGPAHVSVGASTAIFGAVGMLGALGMVRRRRVSARRRGAWIPVAAALALLAMLGTGGGRVDVFAHLFGFLLGGILGALVAFVAPKPPAPRVQWACGSATLALLIYCWILAVS